MTTPPPVGQAEHNRQTQDAYDQLAAVWAATTDDGPFNGFLERPAFRSLVPAGRRGRAGRRLRFGGAGAVAARPGRRGDRDRPEPADDRGGAAPLRGPRPVS